MKTIEKIRQKIEELYDGESPAHALWDGVNEGKKAMKEQMMKEAVAEVEVGMRGDPIEIILDKYVQRAMGIFPGDKVRIIVIPNTDEK